MDARIFIRKVGSAKKAWVRVAISVGLNLRWLVALVLAMGSAQAFRWAGQGTIPITGGVVVRVGVDSDRLFRQRIATGAGVV